MNEKYEPYGEEWEKELKKRPKDFLVNFIKNSILRYQKVEKQNEELIKLAIKNIKFQKLQFGCYDLNEVALIVRIKQQPIEEVLKNYE